jgi:uncharacterized repeat protein (TIGR03803 family)
MARTERHVMSALVLLVLVTVSAAIPAYAQTYSVLYDFGNRSGDPLFPSGSLAQGTDGALYGISAIGGAYNNGTVFKIAPAGTMRVLYNFCSPANCADGSFPSEGLSLRPDGHFLGVTRGGSTFNSGAIFDISESGSLTVVYSFNGGTDGNHASTPIYGADGHFYGATFGGGGASGCGTIYKTSGPIGGFQVLHSFNKTDGCNPDTPVLGTDGNFYGTTATGGTFNGGVVFRMTPAGKVTVLHNFGGTGDSVPNPLVQGGDGNFYGTTEFALSGDFETVFQITPAGTFTVLHQVNGTTDGNTLADGLVQATDGNFYGGAGRGGTSSNPICTGGMIGCGTLFQVTSGGSFSVLYNFDFTTGKDPDFVPFQHTNGVLYGVTDDGGTSTNANCVQGCGVLYSWNSGLPAFVSFVPDRGKVGSSVEILGQGFTSSTTVSFNGTPASATVLSGTYLKATVPSGATTGFVTVTTSSGTLTSNKQFIVTP